MGINERIKKIRKAVSNNQIEFAQELGVGQPYISALETGRDNASEILLRLIAIKYGINMEWLQDGIGTMYKNSESENTVLKINEFVKEVGRCEISYGVGKQEKILAQLAEVVIRCCDIADYYGIDLEAAMIEKLKFYKEN